MSLSLFLYCVFLGIFLPLYTKWLTLLVTTAEERERRREEVDSYLTPPKNLVLDLLWQDLKGMSVLFPRAVQAS